MWKVYMAGVVASVSGTQRMLGNYTSLHLMFGASWGKLQHLTLAFFVIYSFFFF